MKRQQTVCEKATCTDNHFTGVYSYKQISTKICTPTYFSWNLFIWV